MYTGVVAVSLNSRWRKAQNTSRSREHWAGCVLEGSEQNRFWGGSGPKLALSCSTQACLKGSGMNRMFMASVF